MAAPGIPPSSGRTDRGRAPRHPQPPKGAVQGPFRRAASGLAPALMLALLAGCTATLGVPLAGDQVDEGRFGNPTTNNVIVQSAYRDQNGLFIDLQRKFERDVPTTVTFDFNSARLTPEAKQILRRQADWIRQFPEIRFKVFGHTDLVGSAAYNKRLGKRRAIAVVNYLVARGVPRSRLEAVVSYGESQPLIVTEGRERRNRRTVTQVSGFAKNLVGDGLDGKYADLVYRTYVAGKFGTGAVGD